jgi:hypothetical protein
VARLPVTGLSLTVLPGQYAVCRLPAAAVPPLVPTTGLLSVTRTPDETSVVCAEAGAPLGAQVESGWRALVVAGPLDFALTGVLASVAAPLADAQVSIFALSTFDTDYVLVRAQALADAVAALRQAGHDVLDPD